MGAAPSFLDSLDTGSLEVARFLPFPDRDDPSAGDDVADGLEHLLRSSLDPDEVDRSRRLPAGLCNELLDHGYLRLADDKSLGGLGLSAYEVFRVVERAARWSVTAAQIVGAHAGVGAGALLRVIDEGPLREFIELRVREGMVSGLADTGPTGSNNTFPSLTATPTGDGTAYLLRGEKLFISNAPAATMLGVTASVGEGDDRRVAVCFFDTDSPGFTVRSEHHFLGSAGLPNGCLSFQDLRVPREQVQLAEDANGLSSAIASVIHVGRLYATAAPALAIARNCVRWSREFISERSIDGRALADHAEIQRATILSLAQVNAMDSVVRWSLLGPAFADRWFERSMTKNICVTTAWEVVDRTLSLLGGQGLETVASQRRRGAVAIPVERAFRDARGLRVAGNVDFQLDNRAAAALLGRYYLEPAQATEPADRPDDLPSELDLSPGNRAHLGVVEQQVRAFAAMCRTLTDRHPRAELFADEPLMITLGRIAASLFSMTAVLVRTVGGDSDQQELADVYCADTRHRIADLWRRLHARTGPDHAKLTRLWLADPAKWERA